MQEKGRLNKKDEKEKLPKDRDEKKNRGDNGKEKKNREDNGKEMKTTDAGQEKLNKEKKMIVEGEKHKEERKPLQQSRELKKKRGDVKSVRGLLMDMLKYQTMISRFQLTKESIVAKQWDTYWTTENMLLS